MRQLFELCAADSAIRFSPFVWRVIFALKHKGLEYETVARTFLDKDAYAESGSSALPVLRDGDTWVSDSLEIAKYLEATYPDNPLFGSDIAIAQADILTNWCNATILGGLFPMLAGDVCALLDTDNANYFRETREPRLGGGTLEEVASGRDAMLPKFQESLGLLRSTLEKRPFLAGETPGWTDYAAAGPFAWAAIVAPDFETLKEDDAVYAWRERMFDLFDGAVRSAAKAG